MAKMPDGWIITPRVEYGQENVNVVLEKTELVKCKNCKHWEADWTPESHSGHYCPQIDVFSEAEFFCADGEKKEDET